MSIYFHLMKFRVWQSIGFLSAVRTLTVHTLIVRTLTKVGILLFVPSLDVTRRRQVWVDDSPGPWGFIWDLY